MLLCRKCDPEALEIDLGGVDDSNNEQGAMLYRIYSISPASRAGKQKGHAEGSAAKNEKRLGPIFRFRPKFEYQTEKLWMTRGKGAKFFR